MKNLGKVLGGLILVLTLSSFDSSIDKQLNNAVKKAIIKKTISQFKIEESVYYKVQVKISGANSIKGIAKYEELIPVGYAITGMFSDFGVANFDSEKAEVTFLTLNGIEDIEITYYLKGELPINPNGESKFMYVEEGKVANLAIEYIE